jgi:glycosyltransferase involved in cell wall biosynthesis
MSPEPLISIITPAYNAERYIAKAVQSVLKQTWQNWELIIVNDGSSDGTRSYLVTLSDPRIRVIHRANQGVSAARNAALDMACGEYITFLDADDELPHRSLEARADYLSAHPEVDIVDGRISARDEDLQIEYRKYQPYYRGKLLPRLLRLDERVFFGPFYMVRKRCLDDMRFAVGMTHAEDLLFFMEVAGSGDIEYGYVTDLVYIYRKNMNSAMSNMNGLELGYLQLITKVKSLRSANRIDHAILRFKIAKILFLSWWAAGEQWRGITAAMKAVTV